jgi:hypothetical protein
MKPRSDKTQEKESLELFASNLQKNSSRYEEEALTLLQVGRLQKLIEGITVVHFLRDGGSGYQISNESTQELEEVFFQSLDQDPAFRLKLLIDQIAQSEVDASFLINS